MTAQATSSRLRMCHCCTPNICTQFCNQNRVVKKVDFIFILMTLKNASNVYHQGSVYSTGTGKKTVMLGIGKCTTFPRHLHSTWKLIPKKKKEKNSSRPHHTYHLPWNQQKKSKKEIRLHVRRFERMAGWSVKLKSRCGRPQNSTVSI